jgi:hypothetical protein
LRRQSRTRAGGAQDQRLETVGEPRQRRHPAQGHVEAHGVDHGCARTRDVIGSGYRTRRGLTDNQVGRGICAGSAGSKTQVRTTQETAATHAQVRPDGQGLTCNSGMQGPPQLRAQTGAQEAGTLHQEAHPALLVPLAGETCGAHHKAFQREAGRQTWTQWSIAW